MSKLSDLLSSLLQFFGLRKTDEPVIVSTTPVLARKRNNHFETDAVYDLDNYTDEIEESAPPVKRSKCVEIPTQVAGENCGRRRNSCSPTIDLSEANEEEVIPKVWNCRYPRNLEQNDDDVIFLGSADLSKSPTRFKNAYKAPKHVRSPKQTIATSVLKEKPTNIQSTRRSSRRIRSVHLSTSHNFEIIDLCSPRTTPSPQSLCDSCSDRKNERTMRKTPSQSTTTPSHSAYSYLLGSCLARSETPVQPVVTNGAASSVQTIDLTDEPEDDVVFVNSFKSPAPSTSEKATPKSVRVVPKTVDVASTSSPLFNNSFEQRLRGKPCVNNDFVDNVEKHFKANRVKFEKMKQSLSKTREIYKEVNERNIDELILNNILTSIKLYDEVEDEIPDEAAELPGLTPEMVKTVEYAWNQSLNEDESLCTKLKTTIKRRDVLTLKGLQWLNDEVINAYMEMIENRGLEINVPVHTFNTFFYVNITNRGPESVRRWTRKVDIFSKDIILVPIHLQVHWCMVVVQVKSKKIYFYDSMKSSNTAVLGRIMKYLEFEHLDKKKTPLDSNQWSMECPKDIPHQMNGSDCGVFSCMFGEFSARKVPFNFSQTDMPYFRKKMTYELVSGKLIT